MQVYMGQDMDLKNIQKKRHAAQEQQWWLSVLTQKIKLVKKISILWFKAIE